MYICDILLYRQKSLKDCKLNHSAGPQWQFISDVIGRLWPHTAQPSTDRSSQFTLTDTSSNDVPVGRQQSILDRSNDSETQDMSGYTACKYSSQTLTQLVSFGSQLVSVCSGWNVIEKIMYCLRILLKLMLVTEPDYTWSANGFKNIWHRRGRERFFFYNLLSLHAFHSLYACNTTL